MVDKSLSTLLTFIIVGYLMYIIVTILDYIII